MASQAHPVSSPPRPQRLGQIELPQPEIMTAHEVAEYLRMSEQHVTKQARLGVIPGLQCGKIWRFRRKTIESLL